MSRGFIYDPNMDEFKSVQNTRMLMDFYETDPKRGFYGGGGIDARFGNQPITFALEGLAKDTPTWGEGFARALAPDPDSGAGVSSRRHQGPIRSSSRGPAEAFQRSTIARPTALGPAVTS